MGDRARQALRLLRAFAAYAAVAAVVALPISVEQAIENAQFEDRLGTFPVEVSLAHNGSSTIDTGLMGKLYWSQTGAGGFGARVTATGPPEARGTLSSYVTPAFLKANAAFVDDPGEVAKAYGDELLSQVIEAVLLYELVAAVAGGLLLLALFRGKPPHVPRFVGASRARRAAISVGYAAVALVVSLALAAALWARWDGTTPVGQSYAMPGIDDLSFSSPQTREIARQVQPFIEKNTERIRKGGEQYRDTATAALEFTLPRVASALEPREGEVIVLAEADPQGSQVATDVRTVMYRLLREQIGEDAIVLRTIAGDVSSNGTVAEADFVRSEAKASEGIPLAVVKGDHDSETTMEQLEDNDALVLDLETEEIAGLRVAGAADPAFKSLFGGLVSNESGKTETQVGEELRDAVDPDEPVIALVHQPAAAAGYLGIGSTRELVQAEGRETTPYDDGIPDVPPGAFTAGHYHDASGPWVIWNTDGDEITWTVVSQLGTSGGVEETPTFNRFSTPFSVPLKSVSVQLQYFNLESGLQTGYVPIDISPEGSVDIGDREDFGLPGGMPMSAAELAELR